jgi:hypothetical protein
VAAELKGGVVTAGEKRLPAYFSRLSAHAQRIYLNSDAIERFDFSASAIVPELTRALIDALESGAPTIVQRRAQALLDELCRSARVVPLELQVRAVRPHNARGELHGIFYPRGTGQTATNPHQFSPAGASGPLIILWMRTAQRHDVVKPRTFLRTLMHEFGHYLDYALLRLGGSPHSSGFFKRESYLVRILNLEGSQG